MYEYKLYLSVNRNWVGQLYGTAPHTTVLYFNDLLYLCIERSHLKRNGDKEKEGKQR